MDKGKGMSTKKKKIWGPGGEEKKGGMAKSGFVIGTMKPREGVAVIIRIFFFTEPEVAFSDLSTIAVYKR